MNTQDKLDNLIRDCVRAKKIAQGMAAFYKTGFAKKLVETALAMKGDTVGIYIWTGGDNLSIHVDVNSLTGFVDPRLAGILEAWEYLNPKTTSMRVEAGQRMKVFMFRFNGPLDESNEMTPHVDVYVNASIVEDSATCRQVVVGYTEPKAEPIYKLECSEAEVVIGNKEA